MPLTFHWYGFFLGLAAVLGMLLAEKRLQQRKVCEFLPLVGWLPAGALVGARLYHLWTDFPHYMDQPWWVWIAVWQGGLGIFGAIAGVVVLVLGFARWKHIATQKTKTALDILASIFPWIQAFGRLGNWANQELYGYPTSLPWGVFITPQHRLPGLEQSTHFHPLFAYEAILLVVLGVWLGQCAPTAKPGAVFAGYLAGYGALRFGLDYLRPATPQWGVLSPAQWVSLGCIFLGLVLMVKLRKGKGA